MAYPDTGHARNYAQLAHEYAKAASGDRKQRNHGKWVRLAAARHLADLRRPKRWPYYFDPWCANDVCDFIEKLPHVEGNWESPTIVLEPAQIFILASVFGWRRSGDGARRFDTAYIELARKNAKSTLTAGIALYCLACEDEVGPQIVIGATTGEQAGKVFSPAKRMVERTPALREAFGVEAWSRSISCESSGGFVQPINAKSSTQDGWNPHVAILDELHAHKDRGLFDVLRSSAGARRNFLLWMITTAGYNVEGVAHEQHNLVRKVLDGVIDAETVFGVIYTIDDEDDPLDERVWPKANPLIGITPTWESMRSYKTEAIASPDSMGEFRTKRLNVWTTSKSAWINMEHWKATDGAVDARQLKDVSCWGGLDLASTRDITALVFVWWVEGRLKVAGRYYLPEETVWPRTERGNVPYKRWVDEGWLVTTPGNVTDYEFVKADLRAWLDGWNVQYIGFDPWNAAQLVGDLMDEGAPMVEMRQGAKTFHPPMKELERMLEAGMVDRGDDPVLTWAASNIVARRDVNDNMAPDRKNSNEKIDPMVAMLMALGLALGGERESKDSVYNERGILTL